MVWFFFCLLHWPVKKSGPAPAHRWNAGRKLGHRSVGTFLQSIGHRFIACESDMSHVWAQASVCLVQRRFPLHSARYAKNRWIFSVHPPRKMQCLRFIYHLILGHTFPSSGGTATGMGAWYRRRTGSRLEVDNNILRAHVESRDLTVGVELAKCGPRDLSSRFTGHSSLYPACFIIFRITCSASASRTCASFIHAPEAQRVRKIND